MASLMRALFRLLLGRRLPVTKGSLEVDGPHGPITIGRDRYGIPFINAGNEEDAFFGFGFSQGQDRAVQIELTKRAAQGTLAELIGPDVVQIDRLFRRVGFHRAAQAQIDVLEPRTRSILTAFASGVNAGRTTGLRRKPHELVLLRAQITEFTATDILAILKLQSFAIPSNWDTELARLKIISEDGPEALRDLDPTYPDWHSVATPPASIAGPAVDRLAEDIGRYAETVGFAGRPTTGSCPGRERGPEGRSWPTTRT